MVTIAVVISVFLVSSAVVASEANALSFKDKIFKKFNKSANSGSNGGTGGNGAAGASGGNGGNANGGTITNNG
ncbi:MAG: hypothetical protein H0X03_01705, partial [Nitrosopumilus sp.]|nr:hypothetical protein [Nitrosopumilus sp.]